MPSSSKNGLLNYRVSAQWNIMHPLKWSFKWLYCTMEMFIIEETECKIMHELWLQVIFKCLHVDRVNI